MRIEYGLLLLAFAVVFDARVSSAAAAQETGSGRQPVIGTWRLAGLERAAPAQPLAPVASPVGILIQDTGGNVIEIVTRAGRGAPLNPAEIITSYHAFWGTYTVDANRSTITYRISGDLDPGRTGEQIARSFERSGTRLILTESAPAGGPIARMTWERIPDLEALPDYQRDVIGFWQWVSAGTFADGGTRVQEASRDASVIVYAPSGIMAVLYLPPPGRKKFAGPVPSVDEARAAMQGAVSYFGTYLVQPKSRSVFHYQLAAPNPAAVGTSFMRNFEITGGQLVLTFPPTTLNGQQVRNVLTLKRLGGLAEMSGDVRR
jgi:hypothetical protein